MYKSDTSNLTIISRKSPFVKTAKRTYHLISRKEQDGKCYYLSVIPAEKTVLFSAFHYFEEIHREMGARSKVHSKGETVKQTR